MSSLHYHIADKSVLFLTLSIVVVVYFILQTTQTNANHNSFDSTIEKFEISGNTPGNIIDDFDDGVVTGTVLGTISESESVLTIESPGEHSVALQSIFPITINNSSLTLIDAFHINNGAGNFVATSTWTQSNPAIAENDALMLLYPTGESTVEIIVTVHSFNPTPLANLTGWGKNKIFGQASAVLDITDPDNLVVTSLTVETTPRSANITGDVKMAYSFDDSTNEIATIFSDDNGSTQSSPFTPVNISNITGPGTWFLQVGRLEFP